MQDTSKGPEPKNWTWKYQGATPWTPSKGAPRGDLPSLATWMREMNECMNEWGMEVTTKCRDLEARVSEFEKQR